VNECAEDAESGGVPPQSKCALYTIEERAFQEKNGALSGGHLGYGR
jgi:hypothetical protein